MTLSFAQYLHEFIGRATVSPYFQAICPHDAVILPGYQSQMEVYEFLPSLQQRVVISRVV
jgi:hypothetical protein